MATTYQERLDLAAAICRLPGGYQTRTSETDPMIHIKTKRGWAKYTPEQARALLDPEPPQAA